MEDSQEFPDESMRHVEALLSRHTPHAIQRMFQQVLDSRRNSVASSYTSSNSSLRSRLSIASTFSTSTGFSSSTGASDYAPSIASSTSSRSRIRRIDPRSYPSSLDPNRSKTSLLTPSSETGSPLELKLEQVLTPTEDDANSIASPVTFQSDKGQSQSGDTFMFCTYCAELGVLKTFKAKSDWKKHEMRMHETGEDWPCPVIGCSRVHDRQKDFIKHHSRYHSGRPLPSVTDIGIRLLPRRVFGCGFEKCKDVSIGWDERCDHVAKHMKNGSTFEQWKYSNVIRNLIRQEALHDTWKELFASLDERLKESRSHITWSPDNTRVLRQKLQCCDLRPSREEVLITALSLRSDLPLDPSQIQIPPGFVTPSRDSVPNVDQLSREQRMHVLIGNPNMSISHTRLAALNAALLQRSSGDINFGHHGNPTPAMEESERRISYMDIDSNDFLNQPDHSIPTLPPNLDAQLSQPSQSPMNTDAEQQQTPGFIDQPKPTNPLGWCYPNYFDAAPTFEESDYYDRPSLGHMIPKPLQKIGTRVDPRNSSPHSPSPSQGQHDMGSHYPMQNNTHHYYHTHQPPQPQQPPPPPPPQASQAQHLDHSHHIHHPQDSQHLQLHQQPMMRQQYHTQDPHAHMHLFSPHP